MAIITSALTLFLAAVLGVAAAHKLAERGRLAQATAGLLRIDAAIAMPLTMAAATIEAAAALALLFPPSLPAGALLAALLWAGYGAALFAALAFLALLFAAGEIAHLPIRSAAR